MYQNFYEKLLWIGLLWIRPDATIIRRTHFARSRENSQDIGRKRTGFARRKTSGAIGWQEINQYDELGRGWKGRGRVKQPHNLTSAVFRQ